PFFCQRPALISNNQHRTLLQGHARGPGCGPWSQCVGLLSLQGVLYPVVRRNLHPFHEGIFLFVVPFAERQLHCHCSPRRLYFPALRGRFWNFLRLTRRISAASGKGNLLRKATLLPIFPSSCN